jgi:biopolymer transport protein ExbB/TolQ
MDFYWEIVRTSPLDQIILLIGTGLFVAHAVGFVGRIRGKRILFVQQLKEYREFLLLLTEILPVLGLIGTVYGLMNTLGGFALTESATQGDLQSIIRRFGPAMSTTMSGLGMVAINLSANALLWLTDSNLGRKESS